MKRAALDRFRAIRDERRSHVLNSAAGYSGERIAPGYFRKGRRMSGCNSSRCWLCHASKLAGLPGLQEHRNNMTFREGLDEASD